MAFDLQAILRSKAKHRLELAALPPGEKLERLEELQKQSAIFKGQRRTANPDRAVPTPNFGGRATSSGVNFEENIAASIAVKMLGGDRCVVWDGLTGADVAAITMQAPAEVDDIVVGLRPPRSGSIYISAKTRSASIALSGRDRAFTETVSSFVRQHQRLKTEGDTESRLVWAVPSSAGRTVTEHLAGVLITHRQDASDGTLTDFLGRRNTKERSALEKFLTVASQHWTLESDCLLSEEDEIRSFLRRVYVETYDFGRGAKLERELEGEIRSHVALEPDQASRIWKELTSYFRDANEQGLRYSASALRQRLTSAGLALKSRPDFSADVNLLVEHTQRNLTALRDHSFLPFESGKFHFERPEVSAALHEAASGRHLLVTGEPGCGKSGMLYSFATSLQASSRPLVLLLAEQLTEHDWKGAANLVGVTHSIDEVLCNWPGGTAGTIVTDALDAIRDPVRQNQVRKMLLEVRENSPGWIVVASVREFDLKFGRELRGAFPGSGVTGHASTAFTGVSHFHLSSLREAEIDQLADQRAEIAPFVDCARESSRSWGIHRSPFYLRLAAELLAGGESRERLSDWNSPAQLLRNYWCRRVTEAPDHAAREATIQLICREMVERRSLRISSRELFLGASERETIFDLRSAGLLASDEIVPGSTGGDDLLQFTHHLLHDYAIACSLIPSDGEQFCGFTERNRFLPILYRHSFMFALEELWDLDPRRERFWQAAFVLEEDTRLHAVTRILAPSLAGSRVEILADLGPLMNAVHEAPSKDSAPHKTLIHLSSGLSDVPPAILRTSALAWSTFAERMLPALEAGDEDVEKAVVQILAALNKLEELDDQSEQEARNRVSRYVLADYVSRNVGKGSQYAAMVSTETICKTFRVDPENSERALRTLLAPDRLEEFPHKDLIHFANQIENLPRHANPLILSLFEAVFSTSPLPLPGEWENRESHILDLRMQTSDEWDTIRYGLANYYEGLEGDEVSDFLTACACIVGNSASKHRSSPPVAALVRFSFRGHNCELVEDFGHVWGRGFDDDNQRVVARFEKLLRSWCDSGNTDALEIALDAFAKWNRSSAMWSLLLEVAADYPSILGKLLTEVLAEPTFLTHIDYNYAGVVLFGAMHRAGDRDARIRLERLILDLPSSQQPGESGASAKLDYAQNRVLAALDPERVELIDVRVLLAERQKEQPLPENRKRQLSKVRVVSEAEDFADRGIDPQTPANVGLLDLKKRLEGFREIGGTDDANWAESNWGLIAESEAALRSNRDGHPNLARGVWGNLVGFCKEIATHAKWPSDDERWGTIRRILIEASADPSPRPHEENSVPKDDWPCWGVPAPRLDAAVGLVVLGYRVGGIDKEIESILRNLSTDPSHALRFNLVERLNVLANPAPDLMWELIDHFVEKEPRFSVIDVLVSSFDRLWRISPEKVKQRLGRITERAFEENPEYSRIFTSLARIYLFRYLREGEIDCMPLVEKMIGECDREYARKAIANLMGDCRRGGWLTAGDAITDDPAADGIRERTWEFFSRACTGFQDRIQKLRASLEIEDSPEAEGRLGRCIRLVDQMVTQLYFASGAHAEKRDQDDSRLTRAQTNRFWIESAPIIRTLTGGQPPRTSYYLVQTLSHLLPCEPREIFLLATNVIVEGSKYGLHQDPLAAEEVVKLIQLALADHREIFREREDDDSECLCALVSVLDLFVEEGWSEARQLTHRLEEIYR